MRTKKKELVSENSMLWAEDYSKHLADFWTTTVYELRHDWCSDRWCKGSAQNFMEYVCCYGYKALRVRSCRSGQRYVLWISAGEDSHTDHSLNRSVLQLSICDVCLCVICWPQSHKHPYKYSSAHVYIWLLSSGKTIIIITHHKKRK